MQAILDENPQYRSLLYPRGFLFTSADSIALQVYPFYGGWKQIEFFEYKAFIHLNQKATIITSNKEKKGLLLIGHAYNPFTHEFHEEELLKALLERIDDEKRFLEEFNDWTGIFALFVYQKDILKIYGDPAGMYTVFYGFCQKKLYVSSHSKLLGDICDLQISTYVENLINYKYYSLIGKGLPGDISPYDQFKRLIPNHFVRFSLNGLGVERFFPKNTENLCNKVYTEIVNEVSQILTNNMSLIYQKWNRCAISLTGGCDSKTTLCCTNGNYDKYQYFSYISSKSEQVDAEAAKKICEVIKVPHHTYVISEKDEDFEDLDIIRKILEYNSGCIGKSNTNDIRKRMFFINNDLFDVEVKSWVSEVGRAYWYKRFLKKKFPKKLTPRYATSLYKVFFTNRKLVRETDKIFADYLKQYLQDDILKQFSWVDLLFWEFKMSSFNGLVITGEQQIAFDITIPYNNRRLLCLFLSAPIEKRINDEMHFDIMKKMNSQIYDSGISVTNIKHTRNRARMEGLYLAVHTKLPF